MQRSTWQRMPKQQREVFKLRQFAFRSAETRDGADLLVTVTRMNGTSEQFRVRPDGHVEKV